MAYVITHALNNKILTLDDLKKLYHENGKLAFDSYPGSMESPQEMFKAIYDYLLEGMPCDRVNQPVSADDNAMIWIKKMCIHTDYWTAVKGDVKIHDALRAEWLQGLVAGDSVVPSAEPVLSAEVAFSHATLTGGLCPLAHVFGPALLTACAEGEVGLLFARPSGLPRAVNEMRATLAGGLGFGASVKLVGPLTVRAGLSGYVPFLRESFEVTLPDGTRQEVFRQSPVTFAGDFGIGVRLP